jgi:hypothetical protein
VIPLASVARTATVRARASTAARAARASVKPVAPLGATSASSLASTAPLRSEEARRDRPRIAVGIVPPASTHDPPCGIEACRDLLDHRRVCTTGAAASPAALQSRRPAPDVGSKPGGAEIDGG